MSIPLNSGCIISALLVLLSSTSVRGGLPMSSHYLELTQPEHAYLFGLIQADGHLYKDPKHPNKGKLQIELAARDLDILPKIQDILPVKSSLTSRVRTTNFATGKMSQTYTLTVCDMHFRQELEDLGVPSGKKSDKVDIPKVPFSEVDYFRGVIDGDGSLGLTSKGFPFLGFVTACDAMANSFITFIESKTGHRVDASRNARDNVYNILVLLENAVTLSNELYYPGCLAISRKKDKAIEMAKWVRPDTMPKIAFDRKRWTEEEDKVVLSSSIEEASENLGRTCKSVSVRKWRLTGKCV